MLEAEQYRLQDVLETKRGVQIIQGNRLGNATPLLEQKYQTRKMMFQNFYPLLIIKLQIIKLEMK